MFENGLLRMERQKSNAASRSVARQRAPPPDFDDAEDIPESSSEVWSGKKTPSQKRVTAVPSFVSTLCIEPAFFCDTEIGTKDINLFINFTNPIQIFYTLYKCKETVFNYLNGPITEQSKISRLLLDVFKTIDDRNFKAAKTICLKNIMRKDPLDLSLEELNLGDFLFVAAIAEAFPLYQVTECGKNCIMSQSRKIYPFRDHVVTTRNNLTRFLSPVCNPVCRFCSHRNSITQFRWAATGPLPILAYSVDITICDLKYEDVPSSIRAVGSQFVLFAFSIVCNGNFSSIFFHGSKKYYHRPGHAIGLITKLPENYKICSIWYLCNELVEM